MSLLSELPINKSDVRDILIISSKTNVSLEYYITPRLSENAKIRTKYFDPFSDDYSLLPRQIDGLLIIINRYVSTQITSWLLKHSKQFTGVLWLIDDDFLAMTTDFSVPVVNKYRPFQTILQTKKLRKITDCLLLSNNSLGRRYNNWPYVVIEPVAKVDCQLNRSLNTKSLYYFAKMHGPEHGFIFPIIEHIQTEYSDTEFNVIADGIWKRKWEKLPRVNVHSEMQYSCYLEFLAKLPSGGIYLVPLTPSCLNHHRSDSKIIDVVRTGSAPVFSDISAYSKLLTASPDLPRARSQHQWVKIIKLMIEDIETAQKARNEAARLLRNRFTSLKYIV